MRWSEYVAHTKKMRNARKKRVRKPQEKKLHGRPRRRWEDNIKMNYKNIGIKG
jgi:hypothetical protein